MIFLHIFHSGGVEPIAELAGDGEEIEVPQEATKFIKKKQPSKKTKKGRITNSISLLLFPLSLYLELDILQLLDSSVALLLLVTLPSSPYHPSSTSAALLPVFTES